MRILSISFLVLRHTKSCSTSTQAFLSLSANHFVDTRTSWNSLPTNSRSFSRSAFSLAMTKRVLVPIADGSEEIETTCITDTLTRFGAEVTVASVMPGGELVCKMSRGIKVRQSRDGQIII